WAGCRCRAGPRPSRRTCRNTSCSRRAGRPRRWRRLARPGRFLPVRQGRPSGYPRILAPKTDTSPTRQRGRRFIPRWRVGLVWSSQAAGRRSGALGGLGQGRLRQLDDLRKRIPIGNGDFRQALAVELDVRPLQAGDELAVAQTTAAAGGADAHDPQTAELALAGLAVAVSIHPRPHQRNDGLTIEVVPAEAEALGQAAHL